MYEVVVHGTRAPIRHRLSRVEIDQMPGAFGDPFRAIEALPGVVPIASGVPYFYVRGAPPGNVGYFFDGIPVPFLYHFAAGPGVLHPAFVDHVDLYPGAYPARYGRFAGAIVAGEMAPPGYRFRGEASVRLIDSGAMLEVPFAGGRGSVMLGGRYSYTALVVSLIVPRITLNYWDYQARARYDLDSHNSLEVLAFGSGDFLSDRETYYENAPSAATERARLHPRCARSRVRTRWSTWAFTDWTCAGITGSSRATGVMLSCSGSIDAFRQRLRGGHQPPGRRALGIRAPAAGRNRADAPGPTCWWKGSRRSSTPPLAT